MLAEASNPFAAAADFFKPLGPKPFTVEHFAEWAAEFKLDSGDPWIVEPFQLEVLADVFAGSPETWMVIPEGNGKTTFIAGLVLYFAEFLERANIVMGASSRDQCQWIHDQAALFVRNSGFEHSKGQKGRFRVLDGFRRIVSVRSGSRIQVFASDDRTGDGVIPDVAILEELHRHRDLTLYRTWAGKLHKRNGQLLAITTAGDPNGEFEMLRTRIKETAELVESRPGYGRYKGERVTLHDYAVPLDGDVEDMQQVKAANPLSTITLETLEAKRKSETMTLAHWRRFTCNQAMRDRDSAIDEREWAAAATDEMIPVAVPIGVGIDLGWKHDTTAMVPLWMASREHRLFGQPKILTPPRDGSSLTPEEVKQAYREIAEINPVEIVVMDTTHGGLELAAWITEEWPNTRIVEYPQTNQSMALMTEMFLEALREGWIKHPDDPEFTRHALNAIARVLNNGRTRFDRASESRAAGFQDERVWDALTAAAMVHASMAAELDTAFNYPEMRFGVL